VVLAVLVVTFVRIKYRHENSYLMGCSDVSLGETGTDV
jgi:hypothetical protein